MACIDALSQDNYLNINKSVAKLFGLQTAAYWAALSQVLTKVRKKKKFDEQGFFKLDRKFIHEQTTLSTADQIKCDKILVNAGVIAVDQDDQNKVSIDAQMILSLIINSDVKEITKKVKTIAGKITPAEKRVARTDAIKSTMKRFIDETDDRLYQAYCSWVDVISENRKINKVTVEAFQKAVREFSDNKDEQCKIIEIAASYTYIDAHWAIERYLKMCAANPTSLKPQKVGTAVNDEVIF